MKKLFLLFACVVLFSCTPKETEKPIEESVKFLPASEKQVSTVLTGFKPNFVNPDYELKDAYINKIQEGHYILCGKLYGPGMEGDPGAWHLVGDESKITHVECISSGATAASMWPQSKNLSIADDRVRDLWYYVDSLDSH